MNLIGKSYIQAKVTALAADDVNGNGLGVSETNAILYNIDSEDLKKKADDTKKKLAGEPKDRDVIRFYINQSFMMT